MRIWLLYCPKLGLLCMLILGVATFIPSSVAGDRFFGFIRITLMSLAGIGVLLGVWFFILRPPVRLRCPSCGRVGEIVLVGPRRLFLGPEVGIRCWTCGLAHAHPLTDFRFRVDPPKREGER